MIRESLASRALRFGRALVVGSGATVVDFSVLTTCIRAFGVAPTTARLPALLAGACVQFLGNRSFTFRAQRGSLPRQVRFFVATELAALAMNFMLFRWLAPHGGSIPPEIVSFAGTFFVFVAFAYPMRRWVVFRLRDNER